MTITTLPRPAPLVVVTDSDTLAALLDAVLEKAIARAFAEGQRSTLPTVLNVAAASRRFGVSRERIEGWIATGQLPSNRVGSRVLVPTAQLDALTEGGKPKRVQRAGVRQ